MAEPFRGVVNVDIRDSEPDWSPFEPPTAPEGAPNVVYFAGIVEQKGEAVTDDYPGDPPYRFTGGTIKRVAVDVSGEPYVDLEREAAALIIRE